jgi:hypothetical protein
VVKHVRSLVPAWMVPSVVLLEALPLTVNGKLDRAALPDPVASREHHRHEPPATDAEGLVADVWQDVLRVAAVGRGDDFFDLGGHSLLATRVMGRIAALLELSLPMRLIFDHPVLADLAREVETTLEDHVALLTHEDVAALVSADGGGA